MAVPVTVLLPPPSPRRRRSRHTARPHRTKISHRVVVWLHIESSSHSISLELRAEQSQHDATRENPLCKIEAHVAGAVSERAAEARSHAHDRDGPHELGVLDGKIQ